MGASLYYFENAGLRWLVPQLILQWSPPPHIQMVTVKTLLTSACRLASQWVFWYFGALWFSESLEAALPSFSPLPTHGANVYICNCWLSSLSYSYFWFLYTPSFVASVTCGCLDLFFQIWLEWGKVLGCLISIPLPFSPSPWFLKLVSLVIIKRSQSWEVQRSEFLFYLHHFLAMSLFKVT